MSDVIELPEGKSITENYIEYVTVVLEKFGKIAKLAHDGEVSPDDINYGLAQFMEVNLGLLAEYQRAKTEDSDLDIEYQQWYDDKFLAAKEAVNEANTSKGTKPALKEYETYLRVTFKDDYWGWIKKKKASETRVSFIRRLVEQYKKYDQILTVLSSNMRQEMRTLSLPNRLGDQPDKKLAESKVRTSFPSEEKVSQRRKIVS